MAPKGKQPAKGKDAKGKDAKGKDAKGTEAPKTPPKDSALNNLLVNPKFKYAVIGVTATLFLLALVTFSLYRMKKNESDQLFGAIYSIRSVLSFYNDTYYNATAEEVLAGTPWIVKALKKARVRMEEIDHEIKSVTSLLTKGWMAFNASLYYFTTAVGKNFEAAKEDCEKQKSRLAVFTTKEEATFVTNVVAYKKDTYWVGLQKVDGVWKWFTGVPLEGNTESSYWGRNRYKMYNCALLRQCSPGISKCLYDDECPEPRKWICQIYAKTHVIVEDPTK